MVDITVRGAGIFGLSIAWECVRRGAAVTLIDPSGPGAGSSGGLVGALAPHVPENWNAKKAFQLDSLLMAETFWRGVAEISGRSPGYLRSGRLQPIPNAAALARAHQRADTAKTLWQGRAVWEIVPQDKTDWSPQSPTGWLIHDSLSALLHPRQAVGALATALARHGVTVEQEAPDRGKVLWATGITGLAALSAGRSRAMGTGVKGQAALLRHDAGGAPQLFVDGVHIIPHQDGTVAIGSTSENNYAAPDTTDGQLDDVITKARAAVPVLAQAPVIDRWAGIRPRARSRAPMLGKWPERPGHFIANGGFKIGFGMAPKIALVMADLLLEDLNNIPDSFDVAASF
ncbi:NAD(P)/FAD-dependent oxidoreductase [Roseobacter weihaiensis]|uniref:NAD(P)/FAD-dependent oxidoreductase n=1 Tax=Roseobacter weihaiensis TaxID=2763262 RepID=UPI001D0BB262|nr:FAD-binding oxidoreductase [Roseobacter sp. H9]